MNDDDDNSSSDIRDDLDCSDNNSDNNSDDDCDDDIEIIKKNNMDLIVKYAYQLLIIFYKFAKELLIKIIRILCIIFVKINNYVTCKIKENNKNKQQKQQKQEPFSKKIIEKRNNYMSMNEDNTEINEMLGINHCNNNIVKKQINQQHNNDNNNHDRKKTHKKQSSIDDKFCEMFNLNC